MTQRNFFSVSLFVLVILVFFHYSGWLKPVESGLRFVMGKSSFGLYAISNDVKNYFGRWASYRNLFNENQKCLEKVSQLTVNQSESVQLKEENDVLRAQLNFLKKDNKTVVANVIGKNPNPSSNIVIIDKGSNEGLKEGQGVVAGEGILIGKIVKTESNVAQVRLLTDNQSRIAASVLNKEKTIGVINGEHNLRLRLTLIPLTETIKPGDQVVSSNLEETIPKGLLIGQIETVEKELYQPFQTAVIKPAVDLNKLVIVSVLIN